MNELSPQPLASRLILDCSALLPGPFVGKLLATLGARVIKIESPSRPDPGREMPAIYADLNGMKELRELELTTSEGQTQFHELVRQADGLIEGFRPSAKKKLGLDEVTLHAINPRLCISSLVGYPENGPWKDRAGHDMNFEAVTGALSLFNELPALPLADLFTSYRAALNLVAAMDHASRTGKGLRMVASMSDTMREAQSKVIAEYRANGIAPHPGETLFSGKYPCYRLYQAADGRRIAVGPIEAKFWQKFCSIIGHPEIAGDSHATGKRGEEVIATVATALASKPWPHWAPLFESADCCVEPVLEYSEVFDQGRRSRPEI